MRQRLGDVAQLVEHCLCKAGVAGSYPAVSTAGACAAIKTPTRHPPTHLSKKGTPILVPSNPAPNRVQCPRCLKWFVSLDKLKAHSRKQHGER
jgi:hypothetical protein